jgi:hypothetical protein
MEGYGMFYRILQDTESNNTLFVSKSFGEINNLSGFKYVSVSAGLRNLRVGLRMLDGIKEDVLVFSKDIIDNLLIPIDIKYQVSCFDNNLKIGPVIGYLVAKSKISLQNSIEFVKNQETLTYCPSSGFCRSSTVAYPGIQGLFYVFCSEGIDIKNNTVEGYYYNPNYTNTGEMWKEGVLPLPSSVFKRAFMFKDKNRKKLMDLTGNRVFNSYWRSKLDFWRTASKDTYIKNHTPYTMVFRSFDNLEKMLSAFKTVYLKLNLGCFAQGLIRVTKSENSYLIQRASEEDPNIFESKEDAYRYLSEKIRNRSYLIQQGVETLTYNEGTTIFRVIMQKDDSLKWKCTGICPRVGNASGISTNYAPASYVFTFESFLKEVLNLDDESIKEKKQELLDLCFRLCNMSDTTGGHFADAGIDIALDKSLKLWVFEINDGHHHYVPLKIKDEKMYYEVKSNILRYACALCGFKYYKEEVDL